MVRTKEKEYRPKMFSLDVSTIGKLEELVRTGFGKTATEVVEKAIDIVYKEHRLKKVVRIDLEEDQELLTALNYFQSLYLQKFGEYISLEAVIHKLLNRFLLMEIVGAERDITIETVNFFRKILQLPPIKDIKVISDNSPNQKT